MNLKSSQSLRLSDCRNYDNLYNVDNEQLSLNEHDLLKCITNKSCSQSIKEVTYVVREEKNE